MTIKTIIHIHTDYSADSDISLDHLAHYATANGVGCLAVTDHDTIEGAKRMRHAAGVKVIVGEEVSTRDGHLIGLFLEEHIRPGMTARDAALAIKEQGGLVLVPHMYARVFGCGLRGVAGQILDLIDAVEINNGQSFTSRPDHLAFRFADRHGLVKFVGSDTHLPCSIGPCYQEMTDFNTPAQFLRSLAEATLVTGYHPLRYVLPMYYRAARHLLGLPFTENVGVNSEDKRRRVEAARRAASAS